MPQKPMLQIGPTVKVKDDAIVLYHDRGNRYAVAGSRKLSLLVQHLLVRFTSRCHVSIRQQSQRLAQRERSMGKSLFGFQIANQVSAATLGDRGGWQFNARGTEICGYIGGRRLLSNYKHLAARRVANEQD